MYAVPVEHLLYINMSSNGSVVVFMLCVYHTLTITLPAYYNVGLCVVCALYYGINGLSLPGLYYDTGV